MQGEESVVSMLEGGGGGELVVAFSQGICYRREYSYSYRMSQVKINCIVIIIIMYDDIRTYVCANITYVLNLS